MEKPPVLSDDWDNNLYRNVVHVLAECENMIPGGQAERVIEVCNALYGEKIKKARQDTARQLIEDIEKVENPYALCNIGVECEYYTGFALAKKKILSLLRKQ